MDRRTFLVTGMTAAATAFTSELMGTEPALAPAAPPPPSKPGSFWPNGARMAVSLSLMFEASGQPISGAGGFLAEPIQAGLPDLPTNALFAYGYTEGIPRVLDLMDKHGIKLSSFMIGRAVENQPDLAREIVRRGHEAAAHGRTWENSYNLPPEQERQFIQDCADTIERVTGQRPVGWNAFYLRNSVHTLEILQDLGLSLPHRRSEPRRAFYHAYPRQRLRDGAVHLPPQRLSPASVPRVRSGGLRADVDRRVRPTLRRGRHPPGG